MLYHANGGVCLNPPDENCGGKLWWDVTSEDYLRATSWHPAVLHVVEALVRRCLCCPAAGPLLLIGTHSTAPAPHGG